MNTINNLMFEFNKHAYKNSEVYITVGIRNGIVYRNFTKSNKEEFVCNRAFGNVLFNYFRMIDESFLLFYDVLRTTSIITCQCTTEDFVKGILYILKRLFHCDYKEDMFLKAKEKSKSNFENAYTNEAFRAWYKALEITDSNKGFFLDEFVNDITSLDYETFINCANYMLIPRNMFVYVNGNIVDISDSDMELVRDAIPITDAAIAPLGRRFDPYLRQDSHIATLARENYNLSILYFDFLNIEVRNLTKYFILSVLSLALPFDNVEASVDDFDASLVFENKLLMSVKNQFKNPLSKETFILVQQKLLARYAHLLNVKPVIFGSEVVHLATSEILYLDFLSLLDTCSYEKFVELYSKSQIKITEAQIVFKKES